MCFNFVAGAACVLFISHDSYIAAISARFMQLTYGSIDKKVSTSKVGCIYGTLGSA